MMLVSFAAPAPWPAGVIAWVLIGLGCGLIAGLSLRGNRLGLLGDLFFGLCGALPASVPIGFLFRNVEGFGGSLLVAFVGACVAIVMSRALFGTRTV